MFSYLCLNVSSCSCLVVFCMSFLYAGGMWFGISGSEVSFSAATPKAKNSEDVHTDEGDGGGDLYDKAETRGKVFLFALMN